MIKLKTKCLVEAKNYYKGGVGLNSTALKNYTSGDGNNSGFENLVETMIWHVIDDLGINRKRVDINNSYFQSDYSVPASKDPKDPQRMDHHIMIDGEYPLIVESRAWIDKPFYNLKRAVVRNFMELPYVRKQLTKDVKFAFVGLAIDVMPRLIRSCDISQGYGDRVSMFKFSPYRRGYKKGNYFDHGVNDQGVNGFVNFLYDSLKKYSKTPNILKQSPIIPTVKYNK
jgi:hypothetical protein